MYVHRYILYTHNNNDAGVHTYVQYVGIYIYTDTYTHAYVHQGGVSSGRWIWVFLCTPSLGTLRLQFPRKTTRNHENICTVCMYVCVHSPNLSFQPSI